MSEGGAGQRDALGRLRRGLTPLRGFAKPASPGARCLAMSRLYQCLGLVGLALLACGPPRRGARPRTAGSVSLVIIHTADLHSHLFPERVQVSGSDAARGLGVAGQVSSVGGVARISTIASAIRTGSEHTLYLDSGDVIEGTAAFTEYGGEPELRALSELGVAAVALGNHDLALGAEGFAETHHRFARFPVLASNFRDNGSELVSALGASVVLDANGIRVGVIGVANPNSPSGLNSPDNPFGIELEPTAAAVQKQIDQLRPDVDLIALLSHLGLDADEALISATSGLDVVLGGHQHLALDEALERFDCAASTAAERGCEPRPVVLVHSGALGRYVGELDLTLAARIEGSRNQTGLQVVAASHSLVPVSAEVAEDPSLVALLEPYRAGLQAAGFDAPVAFAAARVERYASNGGDSALGNLITDAIRRRTGADLVIVNSTGIRADLVPGALTRASFVGVLPFGDELAELTLTGAELRLLLNQQARVASSRKCRAPIQLSGARLELKCSGSASTARLQWSGTGLELAPAALYTLVTSQYLADGGSGFEQLAQVGIRRPLGLAALDVLLEAVHELPSCPSSPLPCLDPASLRDGRLRVSRD